MPDYSIRLYQDSDYRTVREIFSRGIEEHAGVAFRHALTLPHIWIILVVVFLCPLLISGYFIISLMAVTISLLILWTIARHIFTSYIQQSLAADMLDIREYYLQREDHCFWVVELDAREVVGTVAAAPIPQPGGKRQMELKRLSVLRGHRGRGIGKALCQTVIDFAQERGVEALVLKTSMIQIGPQKLYEKMGFRRTHTRYPDSYFAKFINFVFVFYQYDIIKE